MPKRLRGRGEACDFPADHTRLWDGADACFAGVVSTAESFPAVCEFVRQPVVRGAAVSNRTAFAVEYEVFDAISFG